MQADTEFHLEAESIVKAENTKVGNESSEEIKQENPVVRRVKTKRTAVCDKCTEYRTAIWSWKERCSCLTKERHKESLEYQKRIEDLEAVNNALVENMNDCRRDKEKMEEIFRKYEEKIIENGSQNEKYHFIESVNKNLTSKVKSLQNENEKLKENFRDMSHRLEYHLEELNEAKIRYSKMNQDYLELKIEYDNNLNQKMSPMSKSSLVMKSHMSNPVVKRAKKTTLTELKRQSLLVKRKNVLKNFVPETNGLPCRVCGILFSSNTSLRTHVGHCLRKMKQLISSKPATPQEVLKCFICDTVYSNKNSLRSHMGHCRKKSETNSESVTVDKRLSLTKPVSTPSPSPPKPNLLKQPLNLTLVCFFCDREFFRPCNLANHMRVHTRNSASFCGVLSTEKPKKLPSASSFLF